MRGGDRPGAWRHGPPARVELRREGGRLTAVVHASPHPAVKALLVAWLGGWAAGEVGAVRLAGAAAESLLPGFRALALLFLAGWTAMGAVAAWALAWCFEGTEELSTGGGELTLRRQVRGLGWTRRFPLARVGNLWIRYDGAIRSAGEVPAGALVRIGFDVGSRTFRLTSSLRHEDALRLLAALGRRPDASRPGAAEAGRGAPPPLPPR